MENVPRIPMFIVPLKSSPVAPDISPIKKKIKKRYGEQMFINENIFRDFLALRTECCKYPNDESSLLAIKRYYAHLMLLKNRIDLTTPKLVEWPWQDAFYQNQFVRTEIAYEEAAILYGLGAAYSLLGRKEIRMEGDSMKTACTYFQCAAWIFQSLRERYGSFTNAEDMTGDLFHIYSLICLSQAQECIVEKAITDKRSPSITAKLVKYLAESYERCVAMVNALDDSVPAKFRKDWSRLTSIKKSYYCSLVNYFLAIDNANEMKFGVSVAHFKLAQADIEEAWRVAKTFTDSMDHQLGQAMSATIQFARELIVNGCAGAIKDNSQIYHESVPQPQDLIKIEGACLAKPTPFDHADPAVIGEDIFKDLLPLKTLKAASVYSEKKADFLRKVLADVEEKDTNLSSFLSSLNLDPTELLKPDSGLSQALLDQCAKFNAMERSPESQLTAQMSALADVSVDVEADLEELSTTIQTTQDRLKAVLPTAPSSKTDPIKEHLNKVIDRYTKFTTAEGQAKESNTRLHEALTEHLKALHILTRTPEEIGATLPNANDLITDSELLEGLDEAARILSKVVEMRAQRTRMLEGLRAALQADDVTQELLVTNTQEERDALYQRHLDVHQKAVDMLNLNLTAQENITKALIDVHAKVGVKKHDILKRRRQRAEEIDDLVRSGEAYDDLILKCGEGQAFYQDISERLRVLHSDLDQINSAIDDLESKLANYPPAPTHQSASAFSVPFPVSVPPSESIRKGPPTLRDVMRARAAQNDVKIGPGTPQPPMAPGAQPYWQPPFAQIQQPNSVASPGAASKYVNELLLSSSFIFHISNRPLTLLNSILSSIEVHIYVLRSLDSTHSGLEVPSPTPGATGQPQGGTQQRQSMPSPQLMRYQVPIYQSPFFTGIQYPSPIPPSQVYTQQYPMAGYPHQQPQPPGVPGGGHSNPSPAPGMPVPYQSGSQSSSSGLLNQQQQQQYKSSIPVQNPPAVSGIQPVAPGMPNPQQQQIRPSILPSQPIQQPPYGVPQGLPGMLNQQLIRNLPSGVPGMLDQQYRPLTPAVQQTMPGASNPQQQQRIGSSTPVSQFVQQPQSKTKQSLPEMTNQQLVPGTPIQQQQFRPVTPSSQPSQPMVGAPMKFSEMMSRNQYTTPPLASRSSHQQVQLPVSGQPNPSTPVTQTTSSGPKMKFSEMMSKGYGAVPNPPPSQQYRLTTPAVQKPNQNPQSQPGQPYAAYANVPLTRLGTPTYAQPFYGGQQYPYPYQQPGVAPPHNYPAPTSNQHSQSIPVVPQQEFKNEAPVPATQNTVINGSSQELNKLEELLPENATPSAEIPQPTASGAVPESVASLDAMNISEDLGKKPILPTVLTQADLEVQRREKQLRAIYDAPAPNLTDLTSVKSHGEMVKVTPAASTSSNPDPLSDQLTLNRFIDATERLLTWLENMNDPVKGGTEVMSTSLPITRLEQTWSRVNEISLRAVGPRPTQAAARCSATKNRRHECVAFDFNRVPLKHDALSKKDDYINASNLDFVTSLGPWCPRYILTQAPLPNTVTDFWSMIFDQACELVILTLPPRRRTSLLPSSIDPSENYSEGAYGDPGDKLRVPPHLPSLKIGSRIQVGTGDSALELRLQAIKLTRPDSVSHQPPAVDSVSQSTCIERILTLRNCGSQQIRTIVHLCYSGPPPTSGDPDSISSFTAFVHTAIGFYKQQRSLTHPIAVVSEDGGGLGGVFIASSAAILHAEVLGRIADVCELAGCLCQQRRGALSQPDQLAATYSVVGLASKQLLARRDIVVGPSPNKSRNSSSTDDTLSEASKIVKKNEARSEQVKSQDFTSSLFSNEPLQLSDMMSALRFAPKPEEKIPEKAKEIEEEPVNAPDTESNGIFSDLPSHLVDLSLDDGNVNGSRHYQARDFVDKEYRESRDNLAANAANLFSDLDPLNSQN
ncbi:hypothetical protein Aperf_G00000077665 [Anoplocephala perfoliata]